jgi:endoglucanase
VWQDDKEAFDELLNWTNANLSNELSLFSWKYGQNEAGIAEVLDSGSATDADQDIALALLFAHKRWAEQKYLDQAREIIVAIWKHEVKEFNDEYYLLPGAWAKDIPGVQLNPSYFAPYAYRIFQQVEPNLNWDSVIESGYKALQNCSQSNFSEKQSVYLPPEWCLISPAGKVVVSKSEGLQDTNYGYNAFRVPWRLAVDYEWNKDPRALAYLENLDFLQQEWQENNKLLATYTHGGEVGDNYESVAAYATNLAVLKILEPAQAEVMYQSKIKEKFFEDDSRSYWDDPTNYYNQNWAWFGTALYADLLPNLWQ